MKLIHGSAGDSVVPRIAPGPPREDRGERSEDAVMQRQGIEMVPNETKGEGNGKGKTEGKGKGKGKVVRVRVRVRAKHARRHDTRTHARTQART